MTGLSSGTEKEWFVSRSLDLIEGKLAVQSAKL